MKKILVIAAAVLLVAGGSGYLFRDQLWNQVVTVATTDIFITDDTDSFDPGIAVGETFPVIRALYRDGEITDVRDFAHHKGMVFIANRSADW